MITKATSRMKNCFPQVGSSPTLVRTKQVTLELPAAQVVLEAVLSNCDALQYASAELQVGQVFFPMRSLADHMGSGLPLQPQIVMFFFSCTQAFHGLPLQLVSLALALKECPLHRGPLH